MGKKTEMFWFCFESGRNVKSSWVETKSIQIDFCLQHSTTSVTYRFQPPNKDGICVSKIPFERTKNVDRKVQMQLTFSLIVDGGIVRTYFWETS